jgi:hypothetical protein
MIFVGIDPGKNGGVTTMSFTKTRRIINCTPFERTLSLPLNADLIVMEKVYAYPGQGSVSTFSFGENYGWYQGLMDSRNIKYELVDPKRWIPDMGIEKPKSMSSAEWKPWKKEILLRLAKALFPDLPYWDRTLSFQRAICDSLLIAEYARRKYCGKNPFDGLSKTQATLERLRTVLTLQRT